MNMFNRPYIVCRCGRVFFEGEDVWAHARKDFEDEQARQKAQEYMRDMMQRAAPGP